MNYKKVIAISFYIVLAGIGVLLRIPPIWLCALYIPYTLSAFYLSYYLYNLDDNITLIDYIKKRFKYPNGIILLAIHILIIWIILFT